MTWTAVQDERSNSRLHWEMLATRIYELLLNLPVLIEKSKM
jgi:ferritin-like protein